MLHIVMPRANTYVEQGHVYHITQRCHNRSFLLKFSVDREEHRERLRKSLKGSYVWLLDYCITSNHLHMLVTARTLKDLAAFMRVLQGQFAKWFNFRKKRSNQYWGGRYHATMIESGEHLWNCMTYIDLNMVRAGVVDHPRDWRWCGYDELVGLRSRYTLLNMNKVIELVNGGDREQFAADYAAALEDAIDRGGMRREPHWSEAIAVGSKEYVDAIAGRIRDRMQIKMQEIPEGAWEIREDEDDGSLDPLLVGSMPYGRILTPKIASKRGVWVLNWG